MASTCEVCKHYQKGRGMGYKACQAPFKVRDEQKFYNSRGNVVGCRLGEPRR